MNKLIQLTLLFSAGVIAFFLLYEHRVHIFGNTPYLLFAVFIGLHFLMHMGHGGHGDTTKKKKRENIHG